jgi:tetratricopeptide (TPR) repeat protein
MDELVRRAVEDEQFDVAVDMLRAIELRRTLSPQELVLKARCLQLHPVTDGRLLTEAENALRTVLNADAEYVPALMELGWFHLNVENNAAEALGAFERAFKLADSAAAEALVGMSRSTEELRSRTAAVAMIEEHSVLRSDLLDEELARLRVDKQDGGV